MIPMQYRRQQRAGFTLIEILTVLVIVSIMAGMVLTTVQGVTTTAKEARTRSIIATVDSVIQELYDSYKYRSYPIEIPDLFTVNDPDSELGYEVGSSEAARVRLMMIRDLQRMEMPDRYSDITNSQCLMTAACNLVKVDGAGNVVGTRTDNSSRRALEVTWNDTAKRQSYLSRLAPTWTLENQSAECLYLIMATTVVGGRPAIANIPSANLGDTDDDQMLEILDGWGEPLQFIRWPVGYLDPNQTIDTASPDNFDAFRSDFAYQAGAGSAQVHDVNYDAADPKLGHLTQTASPWALRPLVISAGEDGELGIALNPWTSSTDEVTDYSYWVDPPPNPPNSPYSLWPNDTDHMGDEALGRTALVYHFVDPYLRKFIGDSTVDFPGRVPGEAVVRGSPDLADNITNYGLQSE